jgi:hypothetical protein
VGCPGRHPPTRWSRTRLRSARCPQSSRSCTSPRSEIRIGAGSSHTSAETSPTDHPDNLDTCNLFEGSAQPFDGEANRDFRIVADALAKTHLTVQIADNIEFDAEGKVATATFELESAGLSGYWRYIYEPGAPLPEDMEGELQNTRIDADRYFQWEDWN